MFNLMLYTEILRPRMDDLLLEDGTLDLDGAQRVLSVAGVESPNAGLAQRVLRALWRSEAMG